MVVKERKGQKEGARKGGKERRIEMTQISLNRMSKK